jgi:hypothetical protein
MSWIVKATIQAIKTSNSYRRSQLSAGIKSYLVLSVMLEMGQDSDHGILYVEFEFSQSLRSETWGTRSW